MDKPVPKSHFPSYLLFASLLVSFWGALIIVLYFPSKNGLGEAFDIAAIYMITRWLTLWLAVALLILRLVLKNRITRSFIYIFCGVLNCMVGLLAIYLYLFHHNTQQWLHSCLLNLLLGFIMLGDGLINYFKDNK